MIGVTVNEGLKPNRIELWIDARNAPYVITKPLHNSQQILHQNEDGSIIIHLFLIVNYEFERIVLGFGNGMLVRKPEKFKKRIQHIIKEAQEAYAKIEP